MTSAPFVLLTLAVSVSAGCAQTSADSADNRATALDSVAGWHAGDAALSRAGASVTQDDSKPVRNALERQYARIAEAYLRRTPDVVLALRTPDFSVSMPNGERWDTNQSAAYVLAGFEQMERTLAVSFAIRGLNVRGDTAAAFIHQQWSRLQMKAGRLRRVVTSACQREIWINGAAGWRLHLVDRIQPLAWVVDGRRIDPTKPYDPRARAYRPAVEPATPCTHP